MNIASREIANIVVYDVFTGKELYQLGHQVFVTCMNFSPDGTILASGSYDNTIKLWDTSTGKEIQSLEGHQGEVYSVSFSPDGGTLASGSEDKTIKLWPIDTSPLDLAGYLDPRNPWCSLEGSKIAWTAPSTEPDKDLVFEFTNVLPSDHVGILRSARSQEEKNRDLFWKYLHAGNWNSARVLYARLTDPASRESAREMTVRKRAAKAQSAFDRGLDHHAGWHLEEITSLLKSEETDPAMLKAKELIKRLKDDLDKRKTSGGRKD